MEFKALAPSDVAPQLSKHLGSEEHVLWQGAPSANTFFGPKVLAIGGGFLAAGFPCGLAGLFKFGGVGPFGRRLRRFFRLASPPPPGAVVMEQGYCSSLRYCDNEPKNYRR